MKPKRPTPDRELNAVLDELVTSIQAILGGNLIGVYLQGSFAVGDWDSHSDVDFLVAIDHSVSDTDLAALQEMHGRIYELDSHWAMHLEGSYFPREMLRRDDPKRTPLWYLDNTSRELVLSDHDNELVVRWMVRERGIVLFGPDPRELIDPIPADDLRQEVWLTMNEWAQEIFDNQYDIHNRWAQPFAVLSYCRMLHTLRTARIESKPAGAEWAKNELDPRWSELIQRAWQDRPNPSLKVRQPADPDDVNSTLQFIRYALEQGRRYENGTPQIAPSAWGGDGKRPQDHCWDQ